MKRSADQQEWPPPPLRKLPPSLPYNTADKRGIVTGVIVTIATAILSLWQVLMLGFKQSILFHVVPYINFPLLPVMGSTELIMNWFVLPFLLVALIGLWVSFYKIWQGYTVHDSKRITYAMIGIILNLLSFVLWRLCFFVVIR